MLTTYNKISLHRMDRLFVNAKTAVMPGFENDSVYVEEGTVVIVFNPAISNHFLFLTRWIPETSYDINKSQLVFTCGFFFLWGIFWLLKWIFICPTFSWDKQLFFSLFLSFFSRKIVCKTGWCGFKHRFRAKRIGIRYVWTSIFFENGEKNLHFLWKWSWWLSEIIEHCS